MPKHDAVWPLKANIPLRAQADVPAVCGAAVGTKSLCLLLGSFLLGIAVSGCFSGSLRPHHLLLAGKFTDERCGGTLVLQDTGGPRRAVLGVVWGCHNFVTPLQSG